MNGPANERLAERIRERIEAMGTSAAAVSRDAGLGQDFIRDFLTGRKKRMNVDALVRIARELKVTVPWLQGEDPSIPELTNMPRLERTLPLFGTASGSAGDGSFNVSEDIVDWVPCPPGLMGARDAYALYVQGESMQPRYWPGDLIFISPHRPYRAGDMVVIQARADGETESWIKEFRRTEGNEIVAGQYNPPSEIRFERDRIIEIQRVLTTNELVGV